MPATPPAAHPAAAPPVRRRLGDLRRRLRRAVLARRRLLAALLVGVAALAALRATVEPTAPLTPVTVAAHDLPAGSVVGADDLAEVGFADGTAPTSAARDPVGRVLAGPVAAGEALTEQRLVGPALTAPGRVAVPVRFPDAAMAGLLRVGDRIDLVATDAQSGGARTVAAGVPVLALPAPDASAPVGGTPGGRLVVVGVLESQVTSVSEAGVRHFLTLAWSR